MNIKTVIFSVVFIAATGGVFYIATRPSAISSVDTPSTTNQVKGSEKSQTSTVPATISGNVRSQYRKEDFSKHLELTPANIVWFTNYYRVEQKLKPLTEVNALDRSAHNKGIDMFAYQYFDHTRPGTDVSFDRFFDNQHYSFIKIGENLAMGDFKTSYEVVDAWMKSPAHRRNILDPQYTEIGISIDSGMMKGAYVTTMTQHFGNPRKNCPNLDGSAKQAIETLKAQVATIQKDVLIQQSKVSQSDTVADPHYDDLVAQYNKLVSAYNSSLKQMGDLVTAYNKQVKTIDSCITGS